MKASWSAPLLGSLPHRHDAPVGEEADGTQRVVAAGDVGLDPSLLSEGRVERSGHVVPDHRHVHVVVPEGKSCDDDPSPCVGCDSGSPAVPVGDRPAVDGARRRGRDGESAAAEAWVRRAVGSVAGDADAPLAAGVDGPSADDAAAVRTDDGVQHGAAARADAAAVDAECRIEFAARQVPGEDAVVRRDRTGEERQGGVTRDEDSPVGQNTDRLCVFVRGPAVEVGEDDAVLAKRGIAAAIGAEASHDRVDRPAGQVFAEVPIAGGEDAAVGLQRNSRTVTPIHDAPGQDRLAVAIEAGVEEAAGIETEDCQVGQVLVPAPIEHVADDHDLSVWLYRDGGGLIVTSLVVDEHLSAVAERGVESAVGVEAKHHDVARSGRVVGRLRRPHNDDPAVSLDGERRRHVVPGADVDRDRDRTRRGTECVVGSGQRRQQTGSDERQRNRRRDATACRCHDPLSAEREGLLRNSAEFHFSTNG